MVFDLVDARVRVRHDPRPEGAHVAPTTTVRPAHRASRRPARRRLLSTVLLAALSVGLGVSVLGVPTSPVAAPATSGTALAPVAAVTSPELRTFTLNVLHDLPADQARADMERAMTLGDEGGFQEMSDEEDRQTLIALCAAKDWGYYMPPEGGLAIPIVWNRARFRLIDGHTTLVHGPVDGSPSRYINVVRLRELATGKVFGFINTHTISNASFDAQLSDPQKIPLLQKHFAMLRTEILGLFASTENVFVSGDFNVNYLADQRRRNPGLPTATLGDIVNFDMPGTGSRGSGSLLDYGLSVKDNGGLVKTSSQIVYGFNSDHDAVQFTYSPVDLLATGPLFSNPRGTGVQKRAVIDRENRAIQDTEAGATIRVVTSKLDEPSITGQLVAAKLRGVNVQVILGPGGATSMENLLTSYTGVDTAAASWVKRCSGGCLGGSKGTQSNFVLIDRTGGTTNLSMVSSAPFLAKGTSTFGDVYLSSDDALYAGYSGLFTQFLADSDASGARKVTAGSHQIVVYPTAKDPVLTSLSRVKCTNAKGLRVAKRHTNVRAQVGSWSGARGKAIAAKLVTLKRQGCDVQVLTGKKVLPGIKGVLKAAGVKRKSAKVAQNLLVVDGRYGKKNKVSTAWTGGPSWSNGALTSDGTTLVLSDAAAVASYLDDFAKVWKAS